MRYLDEFLKISKAYYNLGLKKARERDLSSAALLLKMALRYDKYNLDARNLLGLIFYECSETADAIAQWVVSINLTPERNKARDYLDAIQNKAGVLETEASLIRRFNQALYAGEGEGDDFAIIELKNIVKNKPNFIRAQNLLALLSLKQGDSATASSALRAVLSVDRTNAFACRLLQETGEMGADKDPDQNIETLSHRELENDDVIIPSTRAVSGYSAFLIHILIGIVLGLLSFYILILPTVRRSYNESLNDSIIKNSDALSDINASYASLSSDYDELLAKYSDVESRLNAYEQENLDFTDAYEKLNSIISDCARGDYLSAALTYTSLNRENISAQPLSDLLNDCDRLMMTEGFDSVEALGTDEWNGGNKQKAEEYYRLCLSIKENDPEVLYLLGRLLQSQDRILEANEIFDTIVGEHPESPYAQRAVTARGY